MPHPAHAAQKQTPQQGGKRAAGTIRQQVWQGVTCCLHLTSARQLHHPHIDMDIIRVDVCVQYRGITTCTYCTNTPAESMHTGLHCPGMAGHLLLNTLPSEVPPDTAFHHASRQHCCYQQHPCSPSGLSPVLLLRLVPPRAHHQHLPGFVTDRQLQLQLSLVESQPG